MSLHPIIYIVLGLIVAVSSAFQPQMILFVFIGAGIAIYGGVKLYSQLKKVPPQKKRYSAHEHLHKHHTQHDRIHHRSEEEQLRHHNHMHSQQTRQSQQHSHSHQHMNTNNMNVSNNNNNSQHIRPQTKYKTCPSCKHAMHNSYRFCPHCGYGV